MFKGTTSNVCVKDGKIFKRLKPEMVCCKYKCVDIKKECEVQTKAFELGVAPQVYSFNHDTIIMEYIKGLTLHEYKKRGLPDVSHKIYEAINILNKNGICHGDLSDYNIIITDDGNVKIIDYGRSCIKNIKRQK